MLDKREGDALIKANWDLLSALLNVKWAKTNLEKLCAKSQPGANPIKEIFGPKFLAGAGVTSTYK